MKCALAQGFISWVMEAGCWYSLGSCSFSIYRFGNGLLGFHSAACSCVAENEAEVLSVHVMASIKLLSKAACSLTLGVQL